MLLCVQLYTARLDKDQASITEAEAQRLADEIEGKTASSRQQRQERQAKLEFMEEEEEEDEEARFSAVQAPRPQNGWSKLQAIVKAK